MPRAADITYYEELGVPADASPEQIRDAFRALVRLLHPDQQTDNQLKQIAELQMRKINRIYAVLADPERRRRYDDALRSDERTPKIVFSPARKAAVSSKLVARLSWGVAAAVIISVLVWLASDTPAVSPAAGVEHLASLQRGANPPATAEDSNDEIAQLRFDLRLARAERDAVVRELERLRNPFASPAARGKAPPPEPESSAAGPASSATITELPAANAHAAVAAVVALPQKPQGKQFAGFWFYTRPPQGQNNKNHALYPPEFIEASITEQNGTIHGRYRSRYQIIDRAISPDVNFEFIGTANGSLLRCPFNGPGGAKGELTLQLSAENAMSVEWSASELGSMQGLVSGTAKLTRRLD